MCPCSLDYGEASVRLKKGTSTWTLVGSYCCQWFVFNFTALESRLTWPRVTVTVFAVGPNLWVSSLPKPPKVGKIIAQYLKKAIIVHRAKCTVRDACGYRTRSTRLLVRDFDMGVSENRGSEDSTLNSRILIIRPPK